MLKNNLVIFFLLIAVSKNLLAQKNEFLVYAVKNPVSIIENKKESQLKIGRILRDTARLVVRKGGMVTIICNGVNVFTIKKEGQHVLIPYNDSCRTHEESVLSNYFHYIWQQMYVRSPDNPNRSLMSNTGSVIRGKEPEVEFSPVFDTINYASGPLKIGWLVKNYNGVYTLKLFNAATKELVVTKTLQSPYFMMEDLAKSMKAGDHYYWTITLKGWGTSDPKWIHYYNPDHVKEFISGLPEPSEIVEDAAMKLFRVGYMLENAFYLADAFAYYQQAAKAEGNAGICHDKLTEFKMELESKNSSGD